MRAQSPAAPRTGQPPQAPILRVETGMHAGIITQIAHDPARNRLVTVSYDKTLRIWSLPTGRLLETLRVPIGSGAEGQLYGLALSPNGRIAAVTGWTGWEWDGRACIYFFDLETLELLTRLPGLPTMAGNLRFSPDGRRLVVPLSQKLGIRVYDTADFSLVAEDRNYGDNVIGVHFDPRRGRMVTSSLDGHLRLYSPTFERIAVHETEAGHRPVAIRYSPRDDLIAVGYLDQAVVTLHDGDDLERERTLTVDRDSGQRSLQRIAWSRDGKRLIAFGSFDGEGAPPIHEWRAGRRWKRRTLQVSGGEVTTVAPLPDGGFAYAATDPGIGVFDRDGARRFFSSALVADYRKAAGEIRLSPSGDVVEIPLDREGGARLRFDVRQRRRLDPDGAAEGLAPPLAGSERIRLEGIHDSTRPTLNGEPLPIKKHEISHCAAVEPNGRHFVLGTGWSLSRWSEEGTALWRRELSQEVLAVHVPKQGRVVVAALGDGTLRWYRLADGELLLALYPSRVDEEWVLWRPDGYYASSTRGDRIIGWQLNRGPAESADFYRAVQFERVLYRPDLVTLPFDAAIGRPDPKAAVLAARTASFSLREIAPARIRIREAPRDGKGGGSARILVQARSRGLPLRDFAVFVNDIPVTPGAERSLSEAQRQGFDREIALSLSERESRVRVEIFNGQSMGVAERWIETASPAPRARGDLYLLAIGVDEFEGLPENVHLRYAAADATSLAEAYLGSDGTLFDAVHVRVLADGTERLPTRANVVAALDFLKPARAQDTVVLFLASHGISDAAGSYLFVPRDAKAPEIDAVLDGEQLEPPSLIPWHVFFDALRLSAGRRLLVVDTCQAQKIEGTLDLHSLRKRSAASAFALMAASKGDELSQEYELGGHGLFTYALLAGLEGRSDRDGDEAVTLEELFAWTGRFVRENRDARIGEQTPQLSAPDVLREMRLR